eukprot:TRINITY_DN4958_c0_g1_i1.p2 TRINITY_DN4958_c0_g1~~TRINITY_DN4958_c0_g1_i1.p2  ORF type:complete len:142 (+),score=43.12 TRINITY_DN4958_c0_g1_i1:88-513(+)
MSRAGELHHRDMKGGGLTGRGVGGGRSSLFGPPGGGRGGGHQDQTEEIMEEENDKMLDRLGEEVKAVKHLALDIRDEVDTHNNMLDKLGKGFDQATGALKGTMTRLDQVFKSGGSGHMCLLVSFCFMVFVGLYYLIKTKRS